MKEKLFLSLLSFISTNFAQVTDHLGKQFMNFIQLTDFIIFFTSLDFICPENNGFFHDSEQCDLYYECIDNKRELYALTI